MLIFLRNLNGPMGQIEVSPDETVRDLKYKIGDKFGCFPPWLRLVYNTKQLDTQDRTLKQYDVKPYCEIYIIIRVPGAGPAYYSISSCPECPGKEFCEILRYCSDNIPMDGDLHKDGWIALCEAFNISRDVREVIEENHCSPGIRCADVIHRLCHNNPALTWNTIKTYVENYKTI